MKVMEFIVNNWVVFFALIFLLGDITCDIIGTLKNKQNKGE